jgi:hypothetical protein
MQWPMQYAMVKYNQNEQKQWTCGSIGSETDNARNNSEYIGDQAKAIMPTTGRNITRPNTTNIPDESS